VAACLFGTLTLFIFRLCIGYGRELRFRLAYAPYVGKGMLRALVKAGRPLPSETLNAHAAIIAVKKPDLFKREDRAGLLEAKKAAAKFRDEFSVTFKRAGAVILGFEGELALACFGSPLGQIEDIKETEDCSLLAVCMVEELLKELDSRNNGSQLSDCRFGIESGTCAFSWSAASGYTANGRAVVRARLYASLAKRCNVRAVIGESLRKEAGLEARKLSSLETNRNAPDESGNFYELAIN
jgi:hypothetical protein